MMDISTALQDLGVTEYYANYSASGHGKSEVDSAAGTVKTMARKAVIANKAVITDAQSLYDYCKSEISHKEISEQATLHGRQFFYIDKEAVNRDRDNDNKGFKGIRSVHCVKSLGATGELEVRDLSCYCDSCLNNDNESCHNKKLVGISIHLCISE